MNIVNNKQPRRTQRLTLMIMKMTIHRGLLSTHLMEMETEVEVEVEVEIQTQVLISPTHPNFACLREADPILSQWNHILLVTWM